MEAAAGGEDGEEPPREARVLGSELVETYTVRSGEAVRDVRPAGMGAGEAGLGAGCLRSCATLRTERHLGFSFLGARGKPRGSGAQPGEAAPSLAWPRQGEAGAPGQIPCSSRPYICGDVRVVLQDCPRVNRAFKAGLNKAGNLSFAWKYNLKKIL